MAETTEKVMTAMTLQVKETGDFKFHRDFKTSLSMPGFGIEEEPVTEGQLYPRGVNTQNNSS